jgi:lysozyme
MSIVETPGFLLCMDSEGYAKDRGDGWVVAYFDAIGMVYTIGFGSTGSDIKKGTTWTRDHAVLRLQQGWNSAQAGVLRASPILSAYPVMLDALTDFAYNCGVGAYQASTLRRKVNAKEFPTASNEILKWDHAKGKKIAGLTIRRTRERVIFLSQPLKNGTEPAALPQTSASKTIPVGSTIPAQDDPLEQALPSLGESPDIASSENTMSSAAPADDGPQTILGVVSRWLQGLVGALRSHNQTTSDQRDEP